MTDANSPQRLYDILAEREISRIAVVGCCGSGKSTLAKELANALDYPLFHIDQMFWLPGWIQRPADEFRARHNAAIENDRWVMDGNNTGTMPARFARADMIIFFDYPLWLCLFRIFKRIVTHHGKTRPDMADGCPERFDFDFLKYVCNFGKQSRPKIIKAMENVAPDALCMTFTHPRAAEDFFN